MHVGTQTLTHTLNHKYTHVHTHRHTHTLYVLVTCSRACLYVNICTHMHACYIHACLSTCIHTWYIYVTYTHTTLTCMVLMHLSLCYHTTYYMMCSIYIASTATPVTHMKPKLQEILEWVAPYVTEKWEKIFVQLLGDEHLHVMATIRKDYHHSSEKSCQIMFEQWLDLCPNPSWSDLLSALRANSVRKFALAEQLSERLGMYMLAYTQMLCMCVSIVWCMEKVFEVIRYLSISQIKFQESLN